jgi:hypothetical protein
MEPHPQTNGVKPIDAAVGAKNLFNYRLPILLKLAFHRH